MDEFNLSIEDSSDEGIRIDKYLASALPEKSRSYYQKAIDSGFVLVNGKQVKSKYQTKLGDDIVVSIEPVKKIDIQPEDIPIEILYEDDDVIVVNKPKGMVVHPAPGHYSGTLVNALMYHCKDSLSGINGEIRPGIVHRIDMNTTGSLLKEEEGTINARIGRNPKDRKKMAVVSDGREAITHLKVLEQFKGYSYVQFKLETGRTHQIRVHMAHIGHPLLGDDVYGKPVKNLQGQTLHAQTLGFIQPTSGEYVEVNAPLPAYFEDLLTKYRKTI